MTIKKRLARANVVMILAPVLVAFLVVIGGLGLFIYLTETVYLPKLGLTLEELHFVADQFEGTFADFGLALWVLMGILTVTVAVSVYFSSEFTGLVYPTAMALLCGLLALWKMPETRHRDIGL